MAVAHPTKGGSPFFVEFPGKRIELLQHFLIKLSLFQCCDDLSPHSLIERQPLSQRCSHGRGSQGGSLIGSERPNELHRMEPIVASGHARLGFDGHDHVVKGPGETVETRVEGGFKSDGAHGSVSSRVCAASTSLSMLVPSSPSQRSFNFMVIGSREQSSGRVQARMLRKKRSSMQSLSERGPSILMICSG